MTDMTDQPDPSELPALRTCVNCACFGRMAPDGSMTNSHSDTVPVCRRNPPGARQQRVEVPVLQDGHPVMDRGRPRMTAQQAIVIGYPATAPEATCFDGWRPPGTLPGVRWETQRMLEGFMPMFEKALVQSGVSRQQAHELGLAMLTGIMPPRS